MNETLAGFIGQHPERGASMQQLPVFPDLRSIRISGGFWGRYQQILRDAMIPYQWRALNDQIDDAPPSYCLANFRAAAEKVQNGQTSLQFAGMVFQDSDLYKWLEAAAYCIASAPDPDLEKTVDGVISLIGQAQEPDGYLNTYYTLREPEQKWTNLLENHELYCSGHMIEAAVAWFEATGKTNFLQIAVRNANLLVRLFGAQDGQMKGYPGHPEAELALMRLYTVTMESSYLDLAHFFITERGQPPLYFDQELKTRQNGYWAEDVIRPPQKYSMADRPLACQDNLEGHSVRALYLLAGLIDVAFTRGDEALIAAARRLFDRCVSRRMYVTGGVGSTHHGEAFTFDYDLPPDTAYAETCASIALIFAARRLLRVDQDSRYGDVMERALYNTCLAGMQLDGTRFLYVNPLRVWPEASEHDRDHWHVTPERQGWFACACCPPNLARLLGSLGRYAYGIDESASAVAFHLYIESQAEFHLASGQVSLDCKTNYPHDGRIVIQKQGAACRLDLRIPDWCRESTLILDGQAVNPAEKTGYLMLDCPAGDHTVELNLDLPVMRVYGHPAVPETAGQVCLQRGPLVYCLEEADHGPRLWNLRLPRGAAVEVSEQPDLLGGVAVLRVEGQRLKADADHLYVYGSQGTAETVPLTLIPYYAWANRRKGEMTVWLQESN